MRHKRFICQWKIGWWEQQFILLWTVSQVYFIILYFLYMLCSAFALQFLLLYYTTKRGLKPDLDVFVRTLRTCITLQKIEFDLVDVVHLAFWMKFFLSFFWVSTQHIWTAIPKRQDHDIHHTLYPDSEKSALHAIQYANMIYCIFACIVFPPCDNMRLRYSFFPFLLIHRISILVHRSCNKGHLAMDRPHHGTI